MLQFIHVSQNVLHGRLYGQGETFNIGRNAMKREIRAGKPRKKWPVLSEMYGYT